MTDVRALFAAAAGAIRAAAALFLALATPAVVAKELVVKATPCASTIEVRADGVPLEEIVRAVTSALGVRLEAKASLPELTRFEASDTPERVLLRLMQGRNVVLDSNPVAKCGGREALTTVWILPAGVAGGDRPQHPASFEGHVQEPGEAEFHPLRPPRPRGLRKRMSEEEARKVIEEWKAGKVQADPKTGLPVPVEPPTK